MAEPIPEWMVREIAEDILIDHARDVEFLSVVEMNMHLSEDDHLRIHDAILAADIKVIWDE